MRQAADVPTVGELDGRAAIVTGGGSGIGAGVVLELARRGATVFAVDVDGERAARTAAQAGSRVVPHRADVTRAAEVDALVAHAVEVLGGADILVNVAGGSASREVVDMSEDEWDGMIELNLTSVYLCCRAVIPALRARRCGRIVNIASNVAVTGAIGRAHYAAAKAGVIALTKSLALELAPDRVTVNAAAPGPTETPRVRAWFSEEDWRALEQCIPLGRAGRPADIAALVAFLAGDGAAYITGQTIHVNGGFVMP